MRSSIVSNPLHVDEFTYVTQMEAEIIRWTLDLYNGGEDACGIVTSGGTESIILSMLAYREKAKAEKGPRILVERRICLIFYAIVDQFGFAIITTKPMSRIIQAIIPASAR